MNRINKTRCHHRVWRYIQLHTQYRHQLHPIRLLPPPHTSNQISTYLLPYSNSIYSYTTSTEPYKVHHTTTRTVPFTIEQIHNVVTDVNSYSTFLPYCTGAIINSTDTTSHNTIVLHCTLYIQFMVLNETYQSIVTYKPCDKSHIKVNAIKSRMFDRLESNWYLTQNQLNHTLTDIQLVSDVVVSSPLHASIARMFFDTVTKKQIDAFIARLNHLHHRGQHSHSGNTDSNIRQRAEHAKLIQQQRKQVRLNNINTAKRKYSTLRGNHTVCQQPHRTLFGLSTTSATPITHNIRQIIDFPREQLFDVVLDVDRYVEFLPFCVHSKITRHINSTTIEADMGIGFRMFTESYQSLIQYNRPNDISVKAIHSQLFNHLISRWSFRPMHDDTTKTMITFTIDFSVSSTIHAAAVNMFFNEIAQRQMNAFTDRCKQLYQHQSNKLQKQNKESVLINDNHHHTPVTTASSHTAIHSIADRERIAEATQSLTPSRPLIESRSSEYIGHTCKPWWQGRAQFSASDIYKLRQLFHRYAVMNHEFTTTQQHNMTNEAAEIDSITGNELRITLSQWQSIATQLHDTDKLHNTLLIRFRDRAILLAASTDQSIANALFYHNPFKYPLYTTNNNIDTEYNVFTNSDGEISYEEMNHNNNQHINGGNEVTDDQSELHTMGFSEFIQQIYYLTKASYDDKLRYTLFTSCITLIESDSSWGKLVYDMNNKQSVIDIVLPANKLREFSHQQFHMLYGVIQHVMPTMVYQHSKLDQIHSPADDIHSDTINSGIKIMAVMGMMDTVLQQTQLQIHQTIDELIDHDINCIVQHQNKLNNDHPNHIRMDMNTAELSLQQHINGWLQSSRSDVVSTLTVQGISTLINWANALSLQSNKNTNNINNTTINNVVKQ